MLMSPFLLKIQAEVDETPPVSFWVFLFPYKLSPKSFKIPLYLVGAILMQNRQCRTISGLLKTFSAFLFYTPCSLKKSVVPKRPAVSRSNFSRAFCVQGIYPYLVM